ncbi:MAG: [FeFe] hydrogenase H-cluster radical SAM maturase HydE [bacterium]
MSISKKEWLQLLKNGSDSDWLEIKRQANEKKQQLYGKEVFLRGIIEFSNYCRKNCLYCGIRRDSPIKRYRLSESQICKIAKNIYASGVRTVVLQSGEDFYYDRNKIVKIIRSIKQSCDVAITLCIGERSFDDYKAFFDAGASRFLIKHETSNPRLYEFYHPGERLRDRLNLFSKLKKIGYQVGLGNIVGLPKTTLKDYVNDVFLMKALDTDMAGIGPFVPSLHTPLAKETSPSSALVLKVVAMTRLVNEDINIPATTALYTIGGERALKEALQSGANVVMPNFTPSDWRSLYRLYDNKEPLALERTKDAIKKLHLQISENTGERRYAKCA